MDILKNHKRKCTKASLVAQTVKRLLAMQERAGSIPGSGSSPGEGNGNPLQNSCLENLMDRGAWQATVHGIARVRHDLATKPPPPRLVYSPFPHSPFLILYLLCFISKFVTLPKQQLYNSCTPHFCLISWFGLGFESTVSRQHLLGFLTLTQYLK